MHDRPPARRRARKRRRKVYDDRKPDDEPKRRRRKVYHDGKPDDDRKREKRRLAQQRYRRRFDDGRFTVTVEIDGAVVEMLIASRWLGPGECDDRKKVATAIAAMLAEAARR